MNRTELRQRLRIDLHKTYADSDMNAYITMGESLIRSQLLAYGLQYELADSDRSAIDSPIYNLPMRVRSIMTITRNGMPLRSVDRKSLYNVSRGVSSPVVYYTDMHTVEFAGNPAEGTGLLMTYFGLPVPLTDDESNALIEEYPQLYIHAAANYIFIRAQDYDSAQGHMNQFKDLVFSLNKAARTLLGNKEAAPVYNTSFRSSY